MRWFLAILAVMNVHAEVKIETVSWGGWPDCYRITNGPVELVATTRVGPRVMRYAFTGGPNILKEFTDQLGKSGERDWQPRGGHRLWIAPEIKPDTYALDNGAVEARIEEGALILTQPIEPETGLQKSIQIRMDESGRVTLLHRLVNRGTNARELAAWTLTMLTPGGVGIHGLPPRGSHEENLLPTNPLVMWAYTDLSDPRWILTPKYISLRQDAKAKTPQKIGSFNDATWAAYHLQDLLFIKRSTASRDARYPDYNCSFEMFTNHEFLELETLGPLVRLGPGQKVEHLETWSLHRGISMMRYDAVTLDRVVLPLVR
jgi:hypothetical protein